MVSADALKANDLLAFIIPNKEEIAFYMTFHEALVLARERMREIFWRDRPPLFQHLGKSSQRINFLWLVFVSFEVLAELCAISNLLPHRPEWN